MEASYPPLPQCRLLSRSCSSAVPQLWPCPPEQPGWAVMQLAEEIYTPPPTWPNSFSIWSVSGANYWQNAHLAGLLTAAESISTLQHQQHLQDRATRCL